jgi:hypothetical protein
VSRTSGVAALAALSALALLASGCVSVQWRHRSIGDAPAEHHLDALEPGVDSLASVLATLGAPLEVYELEAGGMALVYGGGDKRWFQVALSAPVARNASASGRYGDQRDQLEGALLVLDGRGRLVAISRGDLATLLDRARRRAPAIPRAS